MSTTIPLFINNPFLLRHTPLQQGLDQVKTIKTYHAEPSHFNKQKVLKGESPLIDSVINGDYWISPIL